MTYKTSSKPRALFIGRWQPFHNGHKWLINKKLSCNTPILIAVRDILPDDKNPFTTEQTIEMLTKVYADDDVVIISISDIESVNYGRGVGYAINEHVPPDNICRISASDIRNKIHNQDDTWKTLVDQRIWHLIEKYLV